MISKDDCVWAYYWDGNLHPIPCTFTFSKNQTLLRLWLNWHLPDISHKVCPFKLLKVSDVEHIARVSKILDEIRLVIVVIIIKFESNPLLKTRYRNGLHNISEVSNNFEEVKDVFALANPKKNYRIGYLSWQTFIRDACLLKYKVPLDPNINNSIPQNRNIQKIMYKQI